MNYIRPIILIALFCCWGFNAKAQEPQELSSMPEQWQLTLDVIKSKAQTLLVQNNGLHDQNQQLTSQLQQLQQAIKDQQFKNEQMAESIKERHGQSDQQLRIEQLDQIIDKKKQEARGFDVQLENLTRKQAKLGREIGRLENEIERKTQKASNTVQPSLDDQLPPLQKQLESEMRQEVILENKLVALAKGDKTQSLNADAVEAQNKQLQSYLEALQSRKLQQDRVSPNPEASRANKIMFERLKNRKLELEADIQAFESRLDGLKETSLADLSWPLKRKNLIHTMVEMDSRNAQMRAEIKVLSEDIGVLNDQINRLERRVSFIQGTK